MMSPLALEEENFYCPSPMNRAKIAPLYSCETTTNDDTSLLYEMRTVQKDHRPTYNKISIDPPQSTSPYGDATNEKAEYYERRQIDPKAHLSDIHTG